MDTDAIDRKPRDLHTQAALHPCLGGWEMEVECAQSWKGVCGGELCFGQLPAAHDLQEELYGKTKELRHPSTQRQGRGQQGAPILLPAYSTLWAPYSHPCLEIGKDR